MPRSATLKGRDSLNSYKASNKKGSNSNGLGPFPIFTKFLAEASGDVLFGAFVFGAGEDVFGAAKFD